MLFVTGNAFAWDLIAYSLNPSEGDWDSDGPYSSGYGNYPDVEYYCFAKTLGGADGSEAYAWSWVKLDYNVEAEAISQGDQGEVEDPEDGLYGPQYADIVHVFAETFAISEKYAEAGAYAKW